VLASARGPVPSIAEAIAGEPIRGSWWAHAKGRDIFRALRALDDDRDVLCFKLVDGKVTFVHRRLWPALVRLAPAIGRTRLAAIRQKHTEDGHHENVVTAFPKWAPRETLAEAEALSENDARAMLGAWVGRTRR
jgi:hypothetical protein